jgi:hypothetical protein
MCSKAAADYPGYPWIMSVAGGRKVFAQSVMASLRDPRRFGMSDQSRPDHTRHSWYGVLETVQNLFLVFDLARREKSWRPQWAICEATVLYFFLGGWVEPMYRYALQSALVSRAVFFQVTSRRLTAR